VGGSTSIAASPMEVFSVVENLYRTREAPYVVILMNNHPIAHTLILTIIICMTLTSIAIVLGEEKLSDVLQDYNLKLINTFTISELPTSLPTDIGGLEWYS